MNRLKFIILILSFPVGFGMGVFVASLANSRTKTPPPMLVKPTAELQGSNDSTEPRNWQRITSFKQLVDDRNTVTQDTIYVKNLKSVLDSFANKGIIIRITNSNTIKP